MPSKVRPDAPFDSANPTFSDGLAAVVPPGAAAQSETTTSSSAAAAAAPITSAINAFFAFFSSSKSPSSSRDDSAALSLSSSSAAPSPPTPDSDSPAVLHRKRNSLLRRSAFDGAFPRRIYSDGWDCKPPCAVIVTVHGHGSFDTLFRTVPQQSPDPDHCVAVFEMDFNTLSPFSDYFQSLTHHSMRDIVTRTCIKQVMEEIDSVEPASVVFNFECCGLYARKEFVAIGKELCRFIAIVIEKGFMVMCSDFALKALIAHWNESLLGLCPFQHVGVCEGFVDLAFDSANIANCGSSQLQHVAQMTGEGVASARVKCMSNTILYTLKDESAYRASLSPHTPHVRSVPYTPHKHTFSTRKDTDIPVVPTMPMDPRKRFFLPPQSFAVTLLVPTATTVAALTAIAIAPSRVRLWGAVTRGRTENSVSDSGTGGTGNNSSRGAQPRRYSLSVLSVVAQCGAHKTLDPEKNKMRVLCVGDDDEDERDDASRHTHTQQPHNTPTQRSLSLAPFSVHTHMSLPHIHTGGNTHTSACGFAGHVMLHYESGGKLLTSAAHWLNLETIDVNRPADLLGIAGKLYGEQFANDVREEIQALTPSARQAQEARNAHTHTHTHTNFKEKPRAVEEVLQRTARQVIQGTVPCAYSPRNSTHRFSSHKTSLHTHHVSHHARRASFVRPIIEPPTE